ncbi:xanthine dehydrogenase family protein subunit M [Chloroflexi bacterium TSY]|nr:xanthine dehydrogenase family protein subunit M [Chloroflexi bacterium TSY]
MKPAPFNYVAPTTVDEAAEQLTQHGLDAKILAGGQSLIPTMNFRLAQPSVLVDINPLEELDYIKSSPDGGLQIGAMTRQRTVERSNLVAQYAPLVHAAMPYVAHTQIRNRGTFGGSVAHADPAAELPAILLALNAECVAHSQHRERRITARDFFLDLFLTALEPDELLVEVRLPAIAPRSGWGFHEIARRHGDYAMVGVCATITLDEQDVCQAANLVFLSVGPGPMAATQAINTLVGQAITPAAIETAAQVAATEDIDPSSDIHASSAYRRHLATVLAQRALRDALQRAVTAD